MDDLMQWLRVQLDEDRRIARRVKSSWRQIGETGVIVASDGDRTEECANGNWTGIAEHIVQHDPARVLAEVDAKRRTLIRCEEAMLAVSPMLVHFAEQTAWEMAQSYTDRPGYRAGWRP